MSGGSKTTRICICEEYAPDSLKPRVPQLSCPVCHLWTAITQRTAMGVPLFAGWPAGGVPQKLRAFVQLKYWS